MGLFEDLRNLSEQIKKRQAHVKGEEATKQALVLPFLQVLGFDIYDPTEIRPEYIADFAKKKSSGQFEKIDYALYIKGEPAIFVECKSIDAVLEDHDGQLSRYYNSTPSVKLAVLTNGIQYRFFTELRAPNLMDQAPFLAFNILKVAERDAELLKPFTKENYNSLTIQRHAEEVISLEKITTLIEELLRNPSEKFVRFILSELELGGNKVTVNVVGRFEPIVKKSIQTALLGMMTKSIQQEIAPVSPAPAGTQGTQKAEPAPPLRTTPEKAAGGVAGAEPAAPTVAAGKQAAPLASGSGAGDKDAAGIVTTEEELEVWRTVSRICGESPMKATVKYKDGTNFFALNLGPLRSWFLRLFAGSRRKSFMVRLPVAQTEPLAAGFQVEPVPENPDKSRVYFSALADVERLRPVILRAYEEAVRRQQAGGADAEDSAD